jgi:hypothetical protein
MAEWLRVKIAEDDDSDRIAFGFEGEDKQREQFALYALERAEQGEFDDLRGLMIEMLVDRFGEQVGKRAEVFTLTFVNDRRRKRGNRLVRDGVRIARQIEQLWRHHYPKRARKKNNVEWSASRFAALILLDDVRGDPRHRKMVETLQHSIDSHRKKGR